MKNFSDKINSENIEISIKKFIYKTNSKKTEVLKNISISIPKGQICGIVGPSGCGKSTLIKIIMDLLKPSDINHFEGEIAIFGKKPLDARIGREFSYIPQDSLLFPWWNVIENTLLPLKISDISIDDKKNNALQTLKNVGLDSFANSSINELSVGMKKRVSIARAMISCKKLMLLDEPLASLDELVREEIGMILQKLWNEHDTTAIMVSHDLSETVFFCDRVIVLSHRPSRVIEDIIINLPRPRKFDHKTLPEFFNALKVIRKSLSKNSKDI